MSDKYLTDILKAMMFASGLSPIFKDDYYENLNGDSIGLICEGIVQYFDLERDAWQMNFINLRWLNSPSETIKFWIENKNELLHISE